MGLREKLKDQPGLAAGAAAILVVIAIGVVTYSSWPEKKANLSQAFYTDDDGQSWFADSAYRVPPFDHNGKIAVGAAVYSYQGGKKKFCAFEMRYAPAAKEQMNKAVLDAQKNGQPAESVGLFTDPRFRSQFLQVKRPGAAGQWLASGDPKAMDTMAIHTPDGSEFDQCFVY